MVSAEHPLLAAWRGETDAVAMYLCAEHALAVISWDHMAH